MKNLIYIVNAFAIGFTAGALYECKRLANDEEYHDYWMKRCKQTD